MRRAHFDSLRPICPRCRAERGEDVALTLAEVLDENAAGIREGLLHCPHAGCLLEFPIIDGAPILVRNVRAYVTDNLAHLVARADLSATMEGVLGDCAGSGSAFDVTRQHLSSYAWDHYGEHDPGEAGGEPAPGSAQRCLARALDLLEEPVEGPVIDLGCSVGGTTFALAERFDGLVLGVDLNFAMLGIGRRVLEQGVVRYPRRRVGMVYDRREFPLRPAGAERVDFWICDALALPFADRSFALAAALHLIDCVASPLDLLQALARVLRGSSPALLATPYDWSPAATPVEAWLGGHSQRGENDGASEPVLRALLTPDGHPASVAGLELAAEDDDCPWQVRMHARSVVEYRVHLLLARARAD